MQEVLEACEFVERVRRRVRRACVVDLAAGHGLVGLLLAAIEPQVRAPPHAAAPREATGVWEERAPL